MPTPDEIRRTEAMLVDGAPGRQSRPHLVCPDEIPLTLSQWRMSIATESQDSPPVSPPGESLVSADAKLIDSDCANQSVPSPTSTVDQKPFLHQRSLTQGSLGLGLPESPSSPSLSHEFSSIRLLPSTTCSYLRSGARFSGKQTSDKQKYDVHVELKHVNMSESFLCGYLRIQGLTEDHPTLTTYFEGEMIGPKYSFQTRRQEWGSTEKIDFQHWAKFPAYRPISKQAKKPDYIYKNFAQKEYIFMRWKEYFLVPDHRVKQINGASFEGFYYICFHQPTGSVSGIYFHAKSEGLQRLELSHVQDRVFGSIEFR